MAEPRTTYFVTCASGIEPVLHAEAKELGLAKLERQVGGVRFEGKIEDAWRANLWLRTAIRVLLRLERFDAANGDELYVRAGQVDWAQWFKPETTFVVDAQTNQSALDHSQFIAQRVKDAIVDQLRARTGSRPSVDKEAPDLTVHVHFYKDRCTLSIDTSGASLHKRGWRRFQGRAPLAETSAAAVVMLSGWDKRSPLVDPFCGSGTLLVEAATLAARMAPGLFRERFGFEHFPDHDAGGLAGDAQGRAGGRDSAEEAPADRHRARRQDDRGRAPEPRVGRARRSRRAAPRPRGGLRVQARLERVDRDQPPYGERVGDPREVERTLRTWGGRIKERCEGWTVAMLGDDAKLFDFARLPKGTDHALKNGGLDCQLRVVKL